MEEGQDRIQLSGLVPEVSDPITVLVPSDSNDPNLSGSSYDDMWWLRLIDANQGLITSEMEIKASNEQSVDVSNAGSDSSSIHPSSAENYDNLSPTSQVSDASSVDQGGVGIPQRRHHHPEQSSRRGKRKRRNKIDDNEEEEEENEELEEYQDQEKKRKLHIADPDEEQQRQQQPLQHCDPSGPRIHDTTGDASTVYTIELAERPKQRCVRDGWANFKVRIKGPKPSEKEELSLRFAVLPFQVENGKMCTRCYRESARTRCKIEEFTLQLPGETSVCIQLQTGRKGRINHHNSTCPKACKFFIVFVLMKDGETLLCYSEPGYLDKLIKRDAELTQMPAPPCVPEFSKAELSLDFSTELLWCPGMSSS